MNVKKILYTKGRMIALLMIVLVGASLLFVVSPSLLGGEQNGALAIDSSRVMSETHHVSLGASGAQWPLFFEDRNLPEGLIKEIADDINHICSRYKKYRVLPASERRIREDGKAQHVSASLDLSVNEGYVMPKSLTMFGDIVEVDGRQHILITNELVEKYRKATEFKEGHKEGFEKLDKFIERMNGMGQELIARDIVDLFYLDHLSPNQRNAVLGLARKELVKNPFYKRRMLKPSILEVCISKAQDESQGLFIATSLLKGENSNEVDEIPLVFTDKGWKIAYMWGR